MRKRSWRDLAIFGGEPAFAEKLHVGRPNIGDQDGLLERIEDILRRRWFSNNGPCVVEFEQRICDLLKVRHCIAVCNGTVGLEIAIRALDLRGEVIVPSFTFIATAHAVRWLGLTPVFCDVDCRTHNIDPVDVERRITPRTAAILGVHLWGRPCDVTRLEAIARRHGIPLLLDAAHAFACSRGGRMIGNFGSLEVFSFHATKFLHTLEGGAIATNDDLIAARLRAIRNFGFAGHDESVELGTNGKMNEVSAAMGLTGLESLQEFIATNHDNYRSYQSGLAGLPGIKCVRFGERERSNYQYVVVEIDDDDAPLTRDQMMGVLHAENVLARRYFYPGCHHMEPYRSAIPDPEQRLPVTEILSNRVLVLPTGTAVTREHIARICEIVRLAIANSKEVGEGLCRMAAPSPRGSGAMG